MPDPFRLPPPTISRVPFAGPYSGATCENITAETRMTKVKADGRKTNRFRNMQPPLRAKHGHTTIELPSSAEEGKADAREARARQGEASIKAAAGVVLVNKIILLIN